MTVGVVSGGWNTFRMGQWWAVAPGEGGGAWLAPLGDPGCSEARGAVVWEADLVAAVRELEEAGEAWRWVWRSTAEVYGRLLAAGVRVQRCYDVEIAEQLLLGHEGRLGEPRSAAAAWARLRGGPVPADPPQRSAEPGSQSSLFDAQEGVELPFKALLEVFFEQRRRQRSAERPWRMRLLIATESAGALVATEMNHAGMPWRADVHREVLRELLGERYAGGGEPRRLAELADEVSAAFGRRVRPELPADVLRAFGEVGIRVKSTRRWELEGVDHPAVAPLLAYKRLYRVWVAHGWGWIQDWVREGRFRPEYQPGGTVTGRWTTNGGGALQIPRVIRRAVVADEGWRLVVADAAQLEPRMLAAISGDRGLMEVAAHEGDLYASLSARTTLGDRGEAKLALLGAIYGQTSGDGLKNLAALRRRFPLAVGYVDEAARAGEEGRLVRSWLGRTSPRAVRASSVGGDGEGSIEAADEHEGGGGSEGGGLEPMSGEEGQPALDGRAFIPGYASTNTRARGRFTRNFVVQGSASEWAVMTLAALRQATFGMRAQIVFFQHDEVIVHCPEEEAADIAEAIPAAGALAAQTMFGTTPVRFPFTTAVVRSYSDAGLSSAPVV